MKEDLLDHAQLVEALSDPAFYDHRVDDVRFLQTHISSVFLTGDFVYKLKKPVNFGFIDFSTVELREQYCRANERYHLNYPKKGFLFAFYPNKQVHSITIGKIF